MKKILVLVFSVGILLLSACTAQSSMPEASSASDRAGATESTLPRQQEPISSSAGNEADNSTANAKAHAAAPTAAGNSRNKAF